jgi:hypothetical protein
MLGGVIAALQAPPVDGVSFDPKTVSHFSESAQIGRAARLRDTGLLSIKWSVAEIHRHDIFPVLR